MHSSFRKKYVILLKHYGTEMVEMDVKRSDEIYGPSKVD